MDYITLNNGIKMPKIGYGVYQISPTTTESCVKSALSEGYRLIDTAQCYGNEQAVGKAIRKSSVPRSKIFITTKLWGCLGYKDTLKSIENSLRKLDSEYIDLLLIHEPTGDVYEIYRAMEKVYQKGYLSSIGVSNFLSNKYLDLIKNCSVIPAVNQVETHVFRQQKKLRSTMKEYGTQAEAWSPLASGKNGIFKNKVLNEIAKNHKKTVAQVALRFLYQQDIIVIPKSIHIDRIKENINILDFSLSREEMKIIEKLDNDRSLFNWW